MRDLHTVIASILSVVPESEEPIRKRLSGLLESVEHSPMEVMGDRWHDLDMIVIDMTSPHFGKPFPPWLESVAKIWDGQ